MKLKDEVLIDVIRSGNIESQHAGSIVAVDFDGNILFILGEPSRQTFMRSSVKPMQALPSFTDDDCMSHYRFSSRERAFMMSSHNGERRHQQIGASLQKKVGVTNYDMGCGTHPPYHAKTRKEMYWNREPFSPLCHNCSGNHLVMLALSVQKKWDIKSYLNTDHPYQQEVLKWLAFLLQKPKDRIKTGIDNCSAPAYHLSLKDMALMFARFSAPERLCELKNPDKLDIKKGKEVFLRIINDFWAHPEMIGGEKRLCTYLNKAGKGKFFSKAGAEGMQVTGVVDKGIGIAVKITDGDLGSRAKNTVVIESHYQAGLLGDTDIKKADDLYAPEIPNLRGFKAQKIMPVFKLKFLAGWKKHYS